MDRGVHGEGKLPDERLRHKSETSSSFSGDKRGRRRFGISEIRVFLGADNVIELNGGNVDTRSVAVDIIKNVNECASTSG